MARFTILIALLALGLTACGKKEAPASKTETKPVTKTETKPKAPAPKVEAAPAKKAAGLEGKWTLDVEGMKQFDEFKKLPPEQKKMALAMVSSMKMEIEFTADKIKMNVTVMGQNKSEETPYKVVKQDGAAYTIETVKKSKNPADPTAAAVENKVQQILTLDGDQLIIKEGAKTIALKRLGSGSSAVAPAPTAAPKAAVAPAPKAAPAPTAAPGGATKAGWQKGAANAAGNKATKAGWQKGATNAAGNKATKAGWQKGANKAAGSKATKAGWKKGTSGK